MFEQIDSAIGFSTVMLLLSLLITAVVQVVANVLDLRGRNLRNGIVKLLKQAIPTLSAASKKLGTKSTRPTLAEEVADAIFDHPSVKTPISGLKAIRLDEFVKILDDINTRPPAGLSAEARTAISNALAPVVPGGTQTVAAANALVAALAPKFPTIQADVQQAVASGVTAVRKFEQDTAAWFDTIMDRTSDSFVLHTRLITIVAAGLLVLTLQIDSGEIWGQISTSSELRASLIRMSDSVASEADRVLKQDTTEKDTSTKVSETAANVQKIKAQLSNTKLQIVYTKLTDSKVLTWYTALVGGGFHILGILVSFILLSLGAPFWFNTLSQLSNLKPPTASKIEKESAPPAATKSGTA